MIQNNLKKIGVCFGMLMLAIAVNAVPAKRGLKRTITLADGSQMKVELVGDEHHHYFIDAKGNAYTEDVKTKKFVMRTKAEIEKARNSNLKARFSARRSPRKAIGEKDHSLFRGKKKGLVILVNFKDKKFNAKHTKAMFHDIANKVGYNEGNFKGSVKDYFLAQSEGKFELDFDVVGPVEVSRNMSYYGGNDVYGNDKNPDEMVREACDLIKDSVNYKDYDWDDDNVVDQVFIIYAGYNEAQGGPTSTIWPHEWELGAGGDTKVYNGITVNTYGCSSELAGGSGNNIDGIGTMCHEFSHCLGFPDFYDTNYGGHYGMGEWDLMNSGSYNGDSFTPAGYTSYEKMTCGWLKPIELKDPKRIEGMKAMSEGGESYIIYNDKNKNEYYMLENRQKTGWDAELPGSGLLIIHADYDRMAWENNIVNTVVNYSYASNDHERFTIFHADNNSSSYSSDYDAYPAKGNNSLTATSKPAAKLYNGGRTKTVNMNKDITNITLNNDSTISFDFMLNRENAPDTNPEVTDTVVYKSLYLDELVTTPQKYDAGVYNVRTNRLLKNGIWNALWLPCDVNAESVKKHFGEKTTIAEFKSVKEVEDNVYIQFKTGADSLRANVPYLIMIENKDAITDLGNFMQMSVNKSDTISSVTIDGYTFMGTTKADTLKEGAYYTEVDEFVKAEGTEKMNALNAFFMSEEDSTKNLILQIDEEIVNDIDFAKMNLDGFKNMNIYDINGRLIRINTENLNDLPKGIYIMNGKKYVVK